MLASSLPCGQSLCGWPFFSAMQGRKRGRKRKRREVVESDSEGDEDRDPYVFASRLCVTNAVCWLLGSKYTQTLPEESTKGITIFPPLNASFC